MNIKYFVYLKIKYSAKGKYINSNKFKKIKYFLGSCLLLIKRLKVNIIMLIFKTILKNEPDIIWSLSVPKNGFRNFPIIRSK